MKSNETCFNTLGVVFINFTAEAVSKLRPQRKNIIPSSDATKELKDMEPLFLLLLRRFHVPAEMHVHNY